MVGEEPKLGKDIGEDGGRCGEKKFGDLQPPHQKFPQQ
jgi:hypothetical protein